ncbi:MAG: hypothetical protein JWN52_1896 [Actinomycetia bacterium]|nr:hypothetical protein [Actinomycetes bacterium]
MTLRTDLTALLADAGLIDVDVDEAVADEHVRSSAYRRIISVAAASQNRDGDRAIVVTILRDPEELTSKGAVVAFVDEIAMKATDSAAFQQWAAELLPEIDRLKTEGHREFIRQRVRDCLFYLSIKEGQVPTSAELAGVTHWMQRLLADESTSLPVLTLLVEHGNTRKIRNVAKNRAGSRELRTN